VLQVWNSYFSLAVLFINQPSLQLESATPAKRKKILDKYENLLSASQSFLPPEKLRLLFLPQVSVIYSGSWDVEVLHISRSPNKVLCAKSVACYFYVDLNVNLM